MLLIIKNDLQAIFLVNCGLVYHVRHAVREFLRDVLTCKSDLHKIVGLF